MHCGAGFCWVFKVKASIVEEGLWSWPWNCGEEFINNIGGHNKFDILYNLNCYYDKFGQWLGRHGYNV